MNADLLARLEAEVDAACADAGIARHRLAAFFLAGNPFFGSGAPSVHYAPHYEIDEDPVCPFDDAARAAANSPARIGRHRIGVRCAVHPDDSLAFVAVAGLIRHEVEHARQYDGPEGPELKALDWVADTMATKLDGEVGFDVYRSKPVEASANAAAARFLAARHPERRSALAAGRFAPWAGDLGEVIAPADLPRQTVKWIGDRASLIDGPALFDDGLSWAGRIEAAMPSASRWLSR